MFRATAETTTQDWSALSSWVARQGHVLDASAARQFAGGKANLNYLVALDGRPAVFRRPPAGPIAEGANDMAREWRVLSRLNAGFALAPRGLLYCDDLDVLGAPFQFLEYREGLVIGGELPAGLPGEAPERITATLIEAMTSLHAVKPESVGLGDLGKPEGFLERQLAGWTRRAHAVWPEGLPAIVTNLTSRLEQQIPEQSRVSLLHMDLKLDNMLVDRETLSPNAVIDWDMATRGCPLFDLAILTSYWMEPGGPDRGACRQSDAYHDNRVRESSGRHRFLLHGGWNAAAPVALAGGVRAAPFGCRVDAAVPQVAVRRPRRRRIRGFRRHRHGCP